MSSFRVSMTLHITVHNNYLENVQWPQLPVCGQLQQNYILYSTFDEIVCILIQQHGHQGKWNIKTYNSGNPNFTTAGRLQQRGVLFKTYGDAILRKCFRFTTKGFYGIKKGPIRKS